MLKYFEKDRNIGSISAYSYLNYYKKFKKKIIFTFPKDIAAGVGVLGEECGKK